MMRGLDRTLQDKMAALLQSSILKSSSFLGISIAIMKHNKLVSNIASGARGLLDPRDLKCESLFSLYGLSCGILSLALQVLVKNGKLDVNKSVRSYWSQFQGKDDVLVKHVLEKNTGLEFCIPPSLDTRQLSDWTFMKNFICKADKSTVPTPRYFMFSF